MKNSLVLQMSPLATCRFVSLNSTLLWFYDELIHMYFIILYGAYRISHWRVLLLENGANCLMIFFLNISHLGELLKYVSVIVK